MTAIQDKYNSLPINLGAALSEEESLPDGGTKQHFEFGSIYFHPSVGEAFECHGLILQTYMQLLR